jgi:hypothetical protein
MPVVDGATDPAAHGRVELDLVLPRRRVPVDGKRAKPIVTGGLPVTGVASATMTAMRAAVIAGRQCAPVARQ